MAKVLPFNPVQATLADLTAIKKQTARFGLKKTRKNAYTGFGETRSPFKTKGLDFQEVRVYQPGDDIRQIDWRITAKYGRPFTKLYTDEKERQVFFICDMRSAMKFASHQAFKSVIVARVCAFLAYIAENKKDAVGFSVLTDTDIITTRSFPAKEALTGLFKTLVGASESPLETTTLPLTDAFRQSDKLIKSGALVFILSDFHDWDETADSFVQRWTKKNTCCLVHIYDSLEADIPVGIFPISNGMENTVINTQSKSFIQTYRRAFKHRERALKKTSSLYQTGYLPIRTDEEALLKTAAYCTGGRYAFTD